MGKTEGEKPSSTSKSKKERLLFPTKVVIRRLPPSLTEDQLKEEIGDLPEHDFFYFVGSDMSFGPISFARAYINFKNRDDIVKFRDQFDGYRFVNSKGVEYPAVVEYAPYQGIPKKKSKKDPKMGTILEDPDYLAFVETLNQTEEPPPSIEMHLEEIEAKKSSSGNAKVSTPLLEYLKMKRSSRGRPISARGPPERKRRPEREELPKSPKKGSSSNLSSSKDSTGKSSSSQQPPKEEKPKDERKDAKSREESRRKDDVERKGNRDRDTKAPPPSKDKMDSKSPKGKDEKGRPESGRSGKRPDSRRFDDRRAEERRPNNRRDRGDSSDSYDRGRDDRYRKDNEGGRRDRRSDSRRDSRPSREPETKTKEKESLGKASDSAGKELKPSREQEREPTNAACKEKEKKEKETISVTGENKPQGQESKGSAKDEKRRSDERRVRNKDRPDRALYQPRTGPRGADTRSDTRDTASEKDKSKDVKTKEKNREPERDQTRKTRDD